MESKRLVKCPTCGTPVAWENNPYRPFCSKRCKTIDLGNWADGSYNIESEDTPGSEEEQ